MFINRGLALSAGSWALSSRDNVIDLTFLDHFESATTATGYNFNACDYGAEHVDRYIFACCGRGGTASHTLSSITFNGVAGTIVETQGANLSGTGIAFAKVPSGISGLTTQIVFSASAAGGGLALYRGLARGRTIEAHDTNNTITDNTNIPVDVDTGGIAFIVHAGRNDTVGQTALGFTVDMDTTVTAGTGSYKCGSYKRGTAAPEVDHQMQWDATGDRILYSSASFRLV
jgi:hypothetical protein